jgi:hypothetical protein
MSVPVAYLITWSTYGTWLHGDDRGSVNSTHNIYGTPTLPPSRKLILHSVKAMSGNPVTLGEKARVTIGQSIINTCRVKGWHLHALHVRTTHIHAIVSAGTEPHGVLRLFKSWATRSLKESDLVRQKQVWSEKGSTRYIWSLNQLSRATDYVLRRQGAPMVVFPPPDTQP